MKLRNGDRVVHKGATGTVTVADKPGGRVRVDFDNDVVGIFGEDDLQLTFITIAGKSSKWAQVKACLESFWETQGLRRDQLPEGYSGVLAHYAYELAYRGGLLADAVVEALGVKAPIRRWRHPFGELTSPSACQQGHS